ncbi:deoxyribonuclease-4 [Lachnospiraceae bacterium PF1-21]|uniref:deoxyribonuclease IV n=1 Tax=Ohessyouella blattaphilus TaxID=2949333 RepID=UPI003E2A84EE
MKNNQQFTIGCHLSSSKGFLHMGKEAISIGANTFQFFTRNPRGSKAKPIDEEDVRNYQEYAKANGIYTILAHAPYTLNPASADKKVRDFAYLTIADDLKRMEYVPGNYYNFHPGSHTTQTREAGMENIIQLLNDVMYPEMRTTVLLETMAGKGTEIGRTFEELAAIIEKIQLNDRIGVCLDTCHIFDGGYDIKEHLEQVIEEFDQTIGLDKLKALHLNDSKNPFSSHKDRHEKLGEGSLGSTTFINIINNPRLQGIPCYLETPNELAGYQKEIAFLRNEYRSAPVK